MAVRPRRGNAAGFRRARRTLPRRRRGDAPRQAPRQGECVYPPPRAPGNASRGNASTRAGECVSPAREKCDYPAGEMRLPGQGECVHPRRRGCAYPYRGTRLPGQLEYVYPAGRSAPTRPDGMRLSRPGGMHLPRAGGVRLSEQGMRLPAQESMHPSAPGATSPQDHRHLRARSRHSASSRSTPHWRDDSPVRAV